MAITLNPEDEALVDEKVRSGQFRDRAEVVSHALRLLRRLPTGSSAEQPSAEERAKSLEEFFEEVDRDPPPRKTPLPDEAFDRENLYDDRA